MGSESFYIPLSPAFCFPSLVCPAKMDRADLMEDPDQSRETDTVLASVDTVLVCSLKGRKEFPGEEA